MIHARGTTRSIWTGWSNHSGFADVAIRSFAELFSKRTAIVAPFAIIRSSFLPETGPHSILPAFSGHSCPGPDDIRNGLSSCALHHELFDRGAFTIEGRTRNITAIVANPVLEIGRSTRLSGFHEQPLARIPDCASQRPALESLEWHNHNVFKCYPKLIPCAMFTT